MTVTLSLPRVRVVYQADDGLDEYIVQVANPDMTYAERFAPKLGISGDIEAHPMTMMTIWAWRACKRTPGAPAVLAVDSFTAFDEVALELGYPDGEDESETTEIRPTDARAEHD